MGGVRGYGEAGLDQNKWVEDDGVAKWRRATVREGTPDIVVSSLSYKTYARKRPTIAIVIYNKLYITLVNAQWSSDFARNCFPSFKKKNRTTIGTDRVEINSKYRFMERKELQF